MFFCRRFSFTSYPADWVINNILRLPKDSKDVLGIEESNMINHKKYLGQNSNVVTEYEEITSACNLIASLNVNILEDKSKQQEFKLKLDSTLKIYYTTHS